MEFRLDSTLPAICAERLRYSERRSGTTLCSKSSIRLLSAAVALLFVVFLVLPDVSEESAQKFDFEEHPACFRWVELHQERVCRPPQGSRHGLVRPLIPSPPPPPPYKGFTFDAAVVHQRHGARRSLRGTLSYTPFYGNTHAGQLLPQGAYELHVAGIEMRHYLMDALGLLSDKTGSPESTSRSSDEVYNKTLGVDITEDCRMAGVNPSQCTLSELVFSVGHKIPADALYVRSSALPRTRWSALAFLEGFYGLPFACAGTVAELERTAGGGTACGPIPALCIRRSACDNSIDNLGSTDTSRDICTSQRLPCVHSPPIAEDGMMCGSFGSKRAFSDATAYYESKGVNRTFKMTDPEMREALDVAVKVWGRQILENNGDWVPGDMAFSELGAGETKPLAQLAEWVEEQKRLYKDSTASSNPPPRAYEFLLKNMLAALKDNTRLVYADGKFSRYVISPAVAVQNALFRVKAFGRKEDRKQLHEILYLIGGFDDLMWETAVNKLKMLLMSCHDFIIVGLMEMLGIFDGELLPYAARLTIELSHVETGTGPHGTNTQETGSDRKRNSEENECGSGVGGGGTGAAASGYCSWPQSTHFVRVLLGSPERRLEPVPLPWCGNATACPLSQWLDYTYEKIEGHMFYDVASSFKRKYAAARSGATLF